MLDGLEQMVFDKLLPPRSGAQRVFSGKSSSRGKKILQYVYGSQVSKLLAGLRRLENSIPNMITTNVYGAVFARPGMSLRERELVNVAVLTVQGLERQLYSHLRGALRCA